MLHSALGTAQQCPLCQGSNGSNSISVWPLGDTLCGGGWEKIAEDVRKDGHDVTVVYRRIL